MKCLEWTSLVFLFALLQFRCADPNPDVDRTTSQLITSKGYPVEDHVVVTSDGFILQIQRIPYGKNNNSAGTRPVVLLQHGLLDSSFSWVANSAEQSLGFVLADAGFDVWLGNIRGNTYGQRNKYVSSQSTKFWKMVDFDSMASIDLPAIVDKALNETGQEQLTYIGHSQGTLMGFIGFPGNPELEKKISSFIALAPVAYIKDMNSVFLQYLAKLEPFEIALLFGEKAFLPSDALIKDLARILCYEDPTPCEDVMLLLGGWNPDNLNKSRMDVYVAHAPAGTSVRNMIHWNQLLLSGNCQMFDYGSRQNKKHYNQATPPQYTPGKISKEIPVAFFVGGKDKLADPKDVARLVAEFDVPPKIYSQASYEHMDFTWGINAHTLIYPDVIRFAKQHLAP